MTRTTALLFVVLVPGIGVAQAVAPDMPPGHGGRHMASAAGMPLLDGALPPGTLSVRVVRGAFVEDLAGQQVAVDVLGGKTETARTGPDGRVQIAHLPVGVQMRASAVVAGERLESDVFEMPPDSGVRLLLVAGGVSTAHDELAMRSALFMGASPMPASADPLPRKRTTRSGSDGTLMAAALALTSVAFAAAILRRRRWLSPSQDSSRPEGPAGA